MVYFASESKENDAKYNTILNEFDGQSYNITGKTLAYFKGAFGANLTNLLIKNTVKSTMLIHQKNKKETIKIKRDSNIEDK